MKQTVEPSQELLSVLKPVFSRKALSIKAIDVSRLTSYTDTIIIITGRSSRQVSAMAEHIHTALKQAGMKVIGTEGMDQGTWVLLDYGHIIIHIFDDQTAGFYDLEGLWSDAAAYDLSELEELYPQGES